MGYKDRYGRWPMPLPRSLGNLKWGISERMWEAAWTWTKKRVRGKKYQMPEMMHQNNMVAQAPKRLAGRYHQLKTGHCRTGQYLRWMKNSNMAECGWCRYKTQTMEHLFKNCDRWKPQQEIMWAEIWKKTGRGKNRFTIRDLLADVQCTGAILDFLRTTKVGARMGPQELPPEPTGGREKGDIRSLYSRSFARFLSLNLSLTPFVLFLSLFAGQAGRGQGESPRAAGGLLEGAADGERERTVYNIVMIQ